MKKKSSKGIQGEHVKEQVCPVHMQKARSNEAFVFLVDQYSTRAKQVGPEKIPVLEAFVREKYIGYDQCYYSYLRCIHKLC